MKEKGLFSRRARTNHTSAQCDPPNLESDHRVANSLSLTAALLRMQRELSADDTLRSALQSAEARVASIASFHRHLYGHGARERIDVAEYLGEILPDIGIGVSIHCVLAVQSGASIEVSAQTARSLAIIVNELAVNALKHAYGGRNGGCMTLELEKDGDYRLRLKIADGGPGLPAQFDPDGCEGLGMRIVSSLVREMGGTLSSHTDSGAQFTIAIPKIDAGGGVSGVAGLADGSHAPS